MVRNLVIVAALCLCGMSAGATPLTLHECKAKYKAAMVANGSANGMVTLGLAFKKRYAE